MMFANELSDAALDAMLEATEQSTSPFNLVQLRGLGGAMARVGSDETAFAHRDKRYFVVIVAAWMDALEDPDPYRAWVQSLWEEVRHDGSGVYVNFLEVEGEDRIHDAYPEATYTRLTEIKRKYDPENLFRFNQNVPPR
jgi:hypothetical protein